jgi:hypothetical protein
MMLRVLITMFIGMLAVSCPFKCRAFDTPMKLDLGFLLWIVCVHKNELLGEHVLPGDPEC